jgi:hypothetical protein
MSHISISKKEILFLRENILKYYCESSGKNYTTYCKNLTGTIKYYEDICIFIQESINNRAKIIEYINLVSDSSFKNYLKKQTGESENESKRFIRELINGISANVLRKLIFNGPDEKVQKYKEGFIQVCYIYLGIDRVSFLKNNIVDMSLSITIDNSKPNNRFDKNMFGKSTTIPLLRELPCCTFKPLKDNDEILDTDKPILYFEGKSVSLNRDNIDDNNNTITSKLQAMLRFEEGNWIIENHSQLKTTFIQLVKPKKIQKGDIIIFGNRRFLFDE